MQEPSLETMDALRKELTELRAENERLRKEVRRLGNGVEPSGAGARKRWHFQFLFWWSAGGGYFALVAYGFSEVMAVHFVPTFLVVVALAVVCTALVLAWLAPAALRKDGRRRQFSLRSLLALITLVAVYLASVRWLVVEATGAGPVTGAGRWATFAGLGILCFFLIALSVAVLLRMAESVVWLAAGLVRRGRIRRWLLRRKSARGGR